MSSAPADWESSSAMALCHDIVRMCELELEDVTSNEPVRLIRQAHTLLQTAAEHAHGPRYRLAGGPHDGRTRRSRSSTLELWCHDLCAETSWPPRRGDAVTHIYQVGDDGAMHYQGDRHVAEDQRYVCAAGHRFTGNPPPGIVVCPECGTDDVALDQEQP